MTVLNASSQVSQTCSDGSFSVLSVDTNRQENDL